MLLKLLPLTLLLGSLNLSCQNAEFKGVEKNNAEVCESGEVYTGANFLFLVDNSRSMIDTDCPSGDSANCGPTNRERAILSAFDALTEAFVSSDRDEAISSIAIARFTPDNRNQSFEDMPAESYISVESFPENRSMLEQRLSFTRSPKGDTPYLNAILWGEKFVSEETSANGRKNILVLVTDGEPTDKSPKEVREKAESLDAPIITIRVNQSGLNMEQRRDIHQGVIQKNYSQWTTENYDNLNLYVDDLMSLPQDISSREIIEISSVAELEAKIFQDIILETVPCLPSK
ncbi:VWA domain-containing protein [Pseudobacteriovorax antillogorgiicola]|uniref:von Willebrand factor type A domain-containing protein n=1 Tax=Pseudobacteriovorax antillogorgiicola TaxID=1513793 RepID=A0A1Y6BV22_9BACT|nr:vWA domain-containing protein [Pseudobacteriovorax antillogorgiicola]TCS52323.1 von Willebrand factor type A domain-containing protein [Pseudobacteriovorax antillogorgiicola]SMF30032.1 von Willebrand factor type A domain-containing protein [Pseudobacteriovorax antillogorgiicola]